MGFFTEANWQVGKAVHSLLPECGRCGLYKTCHSPKMKPTGHGEYKVLFVGEAPGKKEDQKGVQLIGESGQLLRDTLRDLHYDLDEGWKTNAVICRPPGNKIDDKYIECCRPNLLKTIRDLKPTVIVLLGSSAVKSLLPTDKEDAKGGIGKWAGWRIPSHQYQAWICPTYHPAFLLRQDDPVLKSLFKRHLKQALKLEKKPIEAPSLEELKKQVEIITSPREARLRMKDLAKKEGRLAFDYEATGLKPDHPDHRIVAVSFCYEGADTWACPFDADLIPSLSRVLSNPRLRKIASNLKHEERWTRRKLGHSVTGWYWDTMIAAHVHNNRSGITGLKFQAYVYFGIADYDAVVHQYFQEDPKNPGFNRVDECPKRDLYLYNGLDSLLEYMLHIAQRKAMGF